MSYFCRNRFFHMSFEDALTLDQKIHRPDLAWITHYKILPVLVSVPIAAFFLISQVEFWKYFLFRQLLNVVAMRPYLSTIWHWIRFDWWNTWCIISGKSFAYTEHHYKLTNLIKAHQDCLDLSLMLQLFRII